jgi:hypothetical protein
MKLAASAALIILSACSKPTEPSVPAAPSELIPPQAQAGGAPPPFQASWVPAAPGSGNFEICLTKDAAENGIAHVTIPANVVLTSWGRMVTSLRDRASISPPDPLVTWGTKDQRREATSYAVITTKPVTLSTDEPCRITSVRTARNEGFDWARDEAPAGLHFIYAPHPTMIQAGVVTNLYWGVSVTGKPNGASRGGIVGDAIGNEYFSGVVLKDVGNPVLLADE